MTKSSVDSKTKMSQEERSELMKKMDVELEEHFAKLEAKAAERGPRGKDPQGWSEDNWEEEMQEHPFFNQGWKEGEELSPMMQGLQVQGGVYLEKVEKELYLGFVGLEIFS